MLVKKEIKKIGIQNPVLIVGLPGIANIGRISVDFLVENLEAERIIDYYSNTFPALVIIDEESNVELPKISLYHKKIGEHELLFLLGDIQPSDEHNYELCEKILEEYKPKQVITIGGIGMPERSKKAKVHVAHNNPEIIRELEKHDLIFDGNEVVSLIIGAAGLMLGLAKLKGINGFALLVETLATQNYFGIRESESVLEIINEKFGLKLDLSTLRKEASKYEKEFKKRSKLEDEIQDYILKHGSELDPSYIG